MQIDVRERRLYLFDEVHTGHLQPISGTPDDPPVPRNVIDKSIVSCLSLSLFSVFLCHCPARGNLCKEKTMIIVNNILEIPAFARMTVVDQNISEFIQLFLIHQLPYPAILTLSLPSNSRSPVIVS